MDKAKGLVSDAKAVAEKAELKANTAIGSVSDPDDIKSGLIAERIMF